ncbi:MAG: hydrogen peroxide-inducible genes activator [Micavibrio aeruginosavorus]|uniref:Hydrogen peroxide-inducible genes activator n=1 Tax=Micavibrio aeruginosavorus TaxID=349221 RepID=A0A7T5R3R6_9BACT|nr:MAG: hydrogen peroxide-inducible genes activator [Micavibrio aeruginosavorus]
MQTPTIRQLEYFLAVAGHLSFHKAAQHCHVTQPALSEGLATLEDLLGEKLFIRSKRDVALTPVGESLVSPARDIITRAENLVLMARTRKEPFTGAITLGIIPTIAPYLLPALLPALQRRFPQMDLQLKEDVTARLLSALDQRKIDIALMAFPYATPGMTQIELWSEPFVIAMPGTHSAIKKPATIDDLSRHNIMLLEDGHCLRDHALVACNLQPGKQRKTFGATSLATLIQMVQHGYGSTLLPAMAANPQTLPRGVAIQRFTNPQPHRKIGLCWRQNDPREEDFRTLGKMIAETNRRR